MFVHFLYKSNYKHKIGYGHKPFKRLTIQGVKCSGMTDFLGKELHIQVGVERVLMSRHLDGEIMSTLSQNASSMGSNQALDSILSRFVSTPR